jgi:hypothetical protein
MKFINEKQLIMGEMIFRIDKIIEADEKVLKI